MTTLSERIRRAALGPAPGDFSSLLRHDEAAWRAVYGLAGSTWPSGFTETEKRTFLLFAAEALSQMDKATGENAMTTESAERKALREARKWLTWGIDTPGPVWELDQVTDMVDSVLAAPTAQPVEAELDAARLSVPPGWKLVPVEPTQAMIDAVHEGMARSFTKTYDRNSIDTYKAMLAAMDDPPGTAQEPKP